MDFYNGSVKRQGASGFLVSPTESSSGHVIALDPKNPSSVVIVSGKHSVIVKNKLIKYPLFFIRVVFKGPPLFPNLDFGL